MALDERANFAKSTLASGIDNSTTSVVVASGEGAKFPTPTVGYSLVIWNMTDYPNPADDPSVEIVRATGLSTDTFTVTRGQEGTSASAHNTAEKEYGVALTVTKKTLDDIDAAYEPADDTLQSSKHTHSNKATLDNITAAYTTSDASKLAGIAEGAEVNVQPDWNQTTNTADDYIKNKPTIPTVPSMAEASDINTGTDTTKTINADALAGSNLGIRYISQVALGADTSLTVADGVGMDMIIPPALTGMNLVYAQAYVDTAGTTNATTIQIHNVTDNTDMLSTNISIASGDRIGTAGTVDTSHDDVATNDLIRIDVDAISTTAPKGLTVVLGFQLP